MQDYLSRIDAALEAVAAAPRLWPMLFIAVFALVLFLPGFFTLPPIDRDETRFSQASRQMVETGDIIDIRLGEGTRYKKPIGIYWLQSASLVLVGAEFQSQIWVYRLPSLVAAVAATLLTYLIALSLVGARAAFLAGLFMATAFVLGGEARLAKTDATLLALILAAQWVLARLHMGGPEAVARIWPWVFWAALGASILVKGPIGPMVIGLTAAALSALRRDIRWLGALRPKRGALLLLAIVLPWYIAITFISGGQFWIDSLGEDFLAKIGEGQESHGAPPGTYLVLVWLTFWPAAILLPFGLALAWRGRATAPVLFCLAWLLPAWLIFELTATKLLHYVLPLYPALAILAAKGWLDRGAQPLGLGWRIGLGAILGLALAFVAAPLIFTWRYGQGPSLWSALGLVLIAGGVVVTWAALRRGLALAPTLGFGLLVLGLVTGLYGHLARFERMWPSTTMANLVAEAAPCPAPRVISVGYQEESLMLLLPRLPVFASFETLPRALEGGACAMVFVEARQAAPSAPILAEAGATEIAQFEAFGLARASDMDFTLYAIAAAEEDAPIPVPTPPPPAEAQTDTETAPNPQPGAQSEP